MVTKFYRHCIAPLWRPIDASFLAVFRMLFGALLLFESVNYGVFLCLDCMYRSSSLLFKYHHFEWVHLWPGPGLEITFLLMALSAIGVMLGWHYRVAIILYTLCFGYLFLLDQALYLNHFYLVILFCSIMIFLPAHHYWSLDARRNPSIASSTVPNWSRLWLVVQLEIVLIYAGLVKLNLDWFNLEPMRLWMTNQSANAHPIFQWLTQDFGIAIASYSVILLHLVGAPLLLWRKTRLVVFFVYCLFHLTNALVFNIGIFPWMTIAATLILFDPDWPKQFYSWINEKRDSSTNKNRDTVRAIELPTEKAFTTTMRSDAPTDASIVDSVLTKSSPKTIVSRTALLVFILGWLLVQALVPLRHFYVPGNVAWNEGGHRFSWRMKLRSKRGTATFYVVRNGAAAIVVEPASHLNRAQVRKMACIPDLIWQYAQFLDKEYTIESGDDVKVYVDTNCSLNTREPTPLINRLIDLSAIPRTEPLAKWVLPNAKELPKKFLPI